MCDEPAFRGDLCSTHTKQMQRTGHTTDVQERCVSVLERVLIAADRLSNAPADDDAEYDRRRRSLEAACAALGQEKLKHRIAAGQRSARRRGVRFGRPPKLDVQSVKKTLRMSARAAARVLGVDPKTVISARHRIQARR